MPRLDRVRALRRRTGWLIVLSLSGLGPMVSVTLAGPALTRGLLGTAVIGARHALRHSRLPTRALPGSGGPATPAGTQAAPASAPATAALHV